MLWDNGEAFNEVGQVRLEQIESQDKVDLDSHHIARMGEVGSG
jgi:hypothetical protein